MKKSTLKIILKLDEVASPHFTPKSSPENELLNKNLECISPLGETKEVIN